MVRISVPASRWCVAKLWRSDLAVAGLVKPALLPALFAIL
jgi:hypothetical protein